MPGGSPRQTAAADYRYRRRIQEWRRLSVSPQTVRIDGAANRPDDPQEIRRGKTRMTNLDKYTKAFVDSFDVDPAVLPTCSYQSIAVWDRSEEHTSELQSL